MSKGERCDRRQWRSKGAERVAGVDEGRRRMRQGHSSGDPNRDKINNAAGVVLRMEPGLSAFEEVLLFAFLSKKEPAEAGSFY